MYLIALLYFRGMALNKLRVFNMTQYRKVIWMDSDTMVLQVSKEALSTRTAGMSFLSSHACRLKSLG